MTGSPRLLDPEVLARLGALRLRIRSATEGVLSGLHRSPHRGQSVEFAEHKEYAPGDDVRRIDWRAYARMDRTYVKQFEQETNLRAHLVVDASASMGWRGPGPDGAPAGPTKFEVAATLAASLAYLLVRQGDAAGLVLTAGEVVRAVPARAAAGHLQAIVEALAAAVPAGETRLGAAVDWIVEHAPRRSAVVVLSDLLDRDEDVLRRLASLARRHHDVSIFHVLDPAELEFPFDAPSLFRSVEDGARVEANGRDVRAGYLELLGAWLERLRREAAEADVDYALCRTDRPVEEALLPYLARRGRRAA